MPVTFENIQIGQTYSRRQLADLWGYAGVEALQRGVVTPRDDNKIILFVTEDKLPSADLLRWQRRINRLWRDFVKNRAKQKS